MVSIKQNVKTKLMGWAITTSRVCNSHGFTVDDGVAIKASGAMIKVTTQARLKLHNDMQDTKAASCNRATHLTNFQLCPNHDGVP